MSFFENVVDPHGPLGAVSLCLVLVNFFVVQELILKVFPNPKNPGMPSRWNSLYGVVGAAAIVAGGITTFALPMQEGSWSLQYSELTTLAQWLFRIEMGIAALLELFAVFVFFTRRHARACLPLVLALISAASSTLLVATVAYARMTTYWWRSEGYPNHTVSWATEVSWVILGVICSMMVATAAVYYRLRAIDRAPRKPKPQKHKPPPTPQEQTPPWWWYLQAMSPWGVGMPTIPWQPPPPPDSENDEPPQKEQ